MRNSVNVVIATYNRSELLARALESLVVASAEATDFIVGVTVVDDDPRRSAEDTAESYEASFRGGLTYVCSGSRNISIARNTGYDKAVGTADWIASIDDDVAVPPRWFEACEAALKSGDFNAVTGSIAKDFSSGPRWLSVEPFESFGITAGTDHQPLDVCATGNNWVRSDFLLETRLAFDTALGRTGGEDVDFFYRAVSRGLRPVFADDAAVLEFQPAARRTFRYQVRRAFWLGVSEGMIDRRLQRSTRLRLMARGTRRALTSASRQLSEDQRVRRGWRFRTAAAAHGVGLVFGALGMRLRHR